MSAAPLEPEVFLETLRREGARRYHDAHPFHVRMHEGRLEPRELRAWVENRYYYQRRIPIKDAIILSKADDPAFRRMWIRRLREHDGCAEGEGGIARWEQLAIGVGIDLGELRSYRRVLPGVRVACDRYVALVRDEPLAVAVASSLTELFAPDLMARRIAAFRAHYPFVDSGSLAYFHGRVDAARSESKEATRYLLEAATTRELQDRCVRALVRKTEILWALLDALEEAR